MADPASQIRQKIKVLYAFIGQSTGVKTSTYTSD
jgi:hypothetical protein